VIDRLLIVLGMVATLAVMGATVVDMEVTSARGDQVFLELAPRDPRSIIQGDYMRLGYRVGRQASQEHRGMPTTGDLVISLDDDRVGTFVRFDSDGMLAASEHRLDYRVRNNRVDVGVGSWMFEEGTADVWNQARYGEFRVLSGGRAVLVGMRDADLQALGPPLKAW